MPYPPPPGPPDLGIFQAIGLVPELPTLVGNYFLTNVSGLTVWSPVAGGVLPDETGHAGEFLTTDGVVASWTNVFPTQTGHAGEFLTTDGSNTSWGSVPGAAFDITNYADAHPNDDTYDVSLAYYEALAAATQAAAFPHVTGVVGKIYFPAGQWYTSIPLVVPGGIEVAGAGSLLTQINAGIGTPATPSKVQGFSGVVLYNAGMIVDPSTAVLKPTYGPSLHTTGQSLIIKDPLGTPGAIDSVPFFLHDAYAWSWFLGNLLDSTNLCFRFEYKATLSAILPNMNRPIIVSRGPPNIWTPPLPDTDQVIGIYLTSNPAGTQLFFKAVLSTQPGWTPGTFAMQAHGVYEEIISSAVTNNTRYDLEIDYDGAHFDFYVNGVNQGHVAMTGPLCKASWEGMTLGGFAGTETSALDPSLYTSSNGLLGSVELANTARHTGTGSFTPTPGPYVADANTLWLCNWDQGQFPAAPAGGKYLPFVLAETRITTAGGGFIGPTAPQLAATLLPHYIRLYSPGVQECFVTGLTVNGNGNCSGLVTSSCSRNVFTDVSAVCCTHFGIKLSDPYSFYSKFRDCAAWTCADIGLQLMGDSINSQSQNCGIGALMWEGIQLHSHLDQPAYRNYASFVILDGTYGSTINFNLCSNDAEAWAYLRQIAPFVMVNVPYCSINTSLNLFTAQASNSSPVLILGSLPRFWTSTNDILLPSLAGGGINPLIPHYDGSPTKFVEFGGSTFSTLIYTVGTIINPGGNAHTDVFDHLPTVNVDNAITIQYPEGATNTQGLSTTDTVAHNLAGIFTVETGYTEGGPDFEVPEVDDNYIVNIQVIGYAGSAPAANSTTITGYVTSSTGFVATVGADPGGTSVITFGYQIVRTPYKPLYFDFLPAAPSTIANPLLTNYSTTTNFSIGVTLVPVTGDVFVWNPAGAYETFFAQGTAAGSGNWFEGFRQGNSIFMFGQEGGANCALQDPVVVRGRLCTSLNPGPHNYVVRSYGGGVRLYFDGQEVNNVVRDLPWGGQSATLHLGERPDGSRPLTTATLKSLKIDPSYKVCFTKEAGASPGSKDQCLFIGDDWSVGTTTSPGSVGSYASQISNTRFASQFWWFGCSGLLNKWVTNQRFPAGPTVFPGLLNSIWIPWGQNQTSLSSMVLMAGWNDILGVNSSPVDGTGITATDVWADMLQVLEGTSATGTFTPPLTPTPPNSFPNTLGFAEYIMPTSGTATCVVGGHSVNCVFTGNTAVMASTLAAALNAVPAIAALVTAYAYNGPQSNFTDIIQLFAVAPGSAGNGITCTTDGVGGAFWYTGFPSTGTTYGGTDITLSINDVEFLANFDTDADTTVNNLITLINADAPTAALVTPSLVSHKLLLTAVTPGSAGDSITLLTNGLNGALVNDSTTVGTLSGGVTGATENGLTTILVCNVPPMGTHALYTAGKETERLALNVLISNWVTAHAGDGAVLADVDAFLQDPGTPANLDPRYDNTTGYLNDDGQTALLVTISPLLPGVGTPPSALTYATNPASYASGGPIAANNPTVSGSPTAWVVAPPLPAGLALNASTGVVTGTPTTPTAAADYTVCASNEAGATTVALNITIT